MHIFNCLVVEIYELRRSEGSRLGTEEQQCREDLMQVCNRKRHFQGILPLLLDEALFLLCMPGLHSLTAA